MDDALPLDADAVEVLLFDLGDVVFEVDFTRAFAHWGAAAGVDPNVLAGRFVRGDTEFRFERGEIDGAEFFGGLRAEMGVDLGDDALEAGWNAIFTHVLPGVPALLDVAIASGLPCWALSNTNASHVTVWPDHFADVLARFEAVLTSHELGHRKPEPAAYRAALAMIGCAPESVLFLDDLAENVLAARAVGMQAVRVGCTEDIRSALVDLGVPIPQS